MDASPLRETFVGDLSSAVVRLAWTGEIDLASVAGLRREIDRIATDVDVHLDVSGVTFIDSTGLGMLVLLRNRVLANGRQLVVCDPPRQLRRVLDITGLDRVFVLRDTRDAAIDDGPGGAGLRVPVQR